MTTKALLVRLDAKSGQEEAVRQFLRGARPTVEDEAATVTWYGMRLGRAKFAIFDAFDDEAGRDVHLSGPVATALADRTEELFASPPDVAQIDVLADKLPDATTSTATPEITKAILLTLKAKAGKEDDLARFLADARSMALGESKTLTWFALDLGGGRFAIFDTFADNGGRIAHLTGRVPRALAKQALSLLGGIPKLTLVDVLAAKVPGART